MLSPVYRFTAKTVRSQIRDPTERRLGCRRSGLACRRPSGAIARVIRARDTIVDVLDLSTAEAAGVLCGLAGTNDDVVDASVVLAARRRGALVLTSDPDDIHRLDPTVVIHDA